MGKHSVSSKDKKDTNKKRKTIKEQNTVNFYRILLIIFIIVFIVSTFLIVKWFVSTNTAKKEYSELYNQVSVPTEQKEEIDFQKLKSINKDIIGWIKVDNTIINYPVLQSNDNEYYLKKDFKNKDSNSGAPFLDCKNKSDFTDKNMVIYGHNIKIGTMFSDLVDIKNGKKGKDVNVTLYTPNKILKFKVASSYQTDGDNTYPINTHIDNDNFEEFKEKILNESQSEFDGELKGSNQVITLFTCDRTGRERILVHAALCEVLSY